MPTDYGIQEALTAVGAAPLVQKRIDPLVNELQRRYSPLAAMVPTVAWNSTVYNWDVRAALPSAGPVLDGGARPVSTSTYQQKKVTLTHLLAVGAVTGYAEAVTQSFGSLRGREIMGAIQSMTWALESQLVGGNATASANGAFPQFNGLDAICGKFSGATQNSITATATFALALLDELIDMVENNIAQPIFNNEWMFVASPGVESKVAQLLTNQQRFNDQVEVQPGLICQTYRNIPFAKTSFLSARGGTMSTITLTQATTGGHLSSGKRYYTITAVLPTVGETKVCTTKTITIASGTTNVVKAAFTPPSTSTGAPVLLYKVWEGSTSGGMRLLGVVTGTVGQTGVNPILTTSIVDTGQALVPHHTTIVPATIPTTYFGGNTAMKPEPATGQDIYLVSRNPANIVRPYVRDCQPVPNLAPTVTGPDQLPFALVTDTALAVRMPTFIGRLRGVKCNLS